MKTNSLIILTLISLLFSPLVNAGGVGAIFNSSNSPGQDGAATTPDSRSLHVSPNQGQINFTGNIVDSTCQVVNNVSNPLNIALGTVAKTAFAGKGSTSPASNFTISLTDCPEILKGVTIKFDGPRAIGNINALALNNDSGVATGVGIQLLNEQMEAISLAAVSNIYSLTQQINQFNFVAQYIATSDSVTAGSANSTATFTLNYN